jgi:hypothetical protein
MIKQEHLIQGFSKFGTYLNEQTRLLRQENGDPSSASGNLNRWEALLQEVQFQNAWFTREQVLYAMLHWSELLQEKKLKSWMSSYPDSPKKTSTIALILAGNIPLVGFHDLLCVLISGHRALVKYASNDSLLLPFIFQEIVRFIPELKDSVTFTDQKLEAFDGVIATGSNNTSRYFEYYFSSKPHIIRKNRNSIAVLTGNEDSKELAGLAEDIFRYFGMGCRSVSKIYVPEHYNFDRLFESFYAHKAVINHQKYANNYDYNKAVYLMSGAPMLDNEFLLLKEDSGLGSPIGTLFFEKYKDLEAVKSQILSNREQIQCIVGPQEIDNSIPFGSSQTPDLGVYADGVDTLKFLLEQF